MKFSHLFSSLRTRNSSTFFIQNSLQMPHFYDQFKNSNRIMLSSIVAEIVSKHKNGIFPYILFMVASMAIFNAYFQQILFTWYI